MTAGAEAAGSVRLGGAAPEPVYVVESLSRALGVLDLAATEDTVLLTARLQVDAATDVVLTPSEDAAYARLVDRINTMWANNSGIDRFLY